MYVYIYIISSCTLEEKTDKVSGMENYILWPEVSALLPQIKKIGASGTGVRQSQARLEKPVGTTRQGCGLGMSVSGIVHDR